jgi:hypothetical protein
MYYRGYESELEALCVLVEFFTETNCYYKFLIEFEEIGTPWAPHDVFHI